MTPLLFDQDFTEVVIAGLLLRSPHADLLRARQVGLAHAPDNALLAWAARNSRLLVSHDQQTMTSAAYARLRRGEAMIGLLIVPQWLAYRIAIDDLALVAYCSELVDWNQLVRFLPLVP